MMSDAPADPALNNPKKRRISSLTLTILAVNMIPVLLLSLGILYLHEYKRNLIEPVYRQFDLERALVLSALQNDTNLDELEGVPLISDLYIYDSAGKPIKSIGRGNLATGDGSLYLAEDLDESISDFSKLLAKMIIRIDPLQPDLPDFPSAFTIGSLPELQATRDHQRGAYGQWAYRSSFVLTHSFSDTRQDEEGRIYMLAYNGDAITTAIDTVRIDIIRAVIFVLILTFLLSVYFSTKISLPLIELNRAAQAIRKGTSKDVDIPDLSYRGDEIGELSVALRRMMQALKNRIHAIETFAADVAHELKNPLTSIRSAIETLDKIDDPKDQETLLSITREDVQRMDTLITDISRSSRLDAELASDMMIPIEAAEFMRTIEKTWTASQEIGAIGPVHISFYIPENDEIMINGHTESLTQLVDNLISNAVSFSPEDGAVNVRVEREDDQCLISIRDEGPGIPSGLEEKIFDRFYTDRSSEYKTGRNSGLGLTIARQVVSIHDGKITAETLKRPGGGVRGAKFSVRLPLLEE